MKSCALANLAAFSTSSDRASRTPIRMLASTVSFHMKVSCKTTAMKQKWLRKSEQGDKWNRCLIEGMIVLSETGARDEQTTPP